jgi:DNA-directed RNA polymerase subunit RPC12/RpoP
MGKKTKAKRRAENNNAPFSSQPESKNNNLEEPINLLDISIDGMPPTTINQETPTKMFDWIQGAADVLSGSALASSEDLDAVFDYHFGKLKGLEGENIVEHPKIACAQCSRKFILHQELHLECTQCGKIYCSQHSNNGALDVCMACWKSRKPEEKCDGGHIKSWDESFYSQRQKFRQQQLQERTQLKKRLSKLILIRRESGGGDSEKILQKRLVNWKNDASTDACSFCKY